MFKISSQIVHLFTPNLSVFKNTLPIVSYYNCRLLSASTIQQSNRCDHEYDLKLKRVSKSKDGGTYEVELDVDTKDDRFDNRSGNKHDVYSVTERLAQFRSNKIVYDYLQPRCQIPFKGCFDLQFCNNNLYPRTKPLNFKPHTYDIKSQNVFSAYPPGKGIGLQEETCD